MKTSLQLAIACTLGRVTADAITQGPKEAAAFLFFAVIAYLFIYN